MSDKAPLLIKGGRIIDPARGLDTSGDVLVIDGRIASAGPGAARDVPERATVIEAKGAIIAPGLIDMRVFIGEPGYEHRETLASASKAAAAGGVTTMVTMPDTDPTIDDPALVDFILRRARDTAVVRVLPMAALTKGGKGREMTEIGLLQEAGAIAFSAGRHAVSDAQVMRRLLTYARDFGALVINHIEDPDLVGSGVMNEGEMASRLGLPGIPREAEIIMVERDVRLAALTRGRYHADQVSCGEAVKVIATAKARGLSVSAGVSINHLTLNENDIGAYRTFFKQSPPLRGEDDRRAVVEALNDGTIDVVVSSHDPQDVETKRHPFAEAADGAIGLETLLAAALRLVHSGDVSLMTVLKAMTSRPAELLGLDTGTLAPGAPADIVIFDPDRPWIYGEETIVSRSKNTPFEAGRFSGRVLHTLVAGESVYTYSPG
ncbi:MAG: dihydroorotase [Hyphomicrobiales bacterium]|nr:MAG: dihydroorotase [Hyphomicrobiales bacterium]